MAAHNRQPGVFTRDTTRTDVPQLPAASAYGEGPAWVDGELQYSDASTWKAKTGIALAQGAAAAAANTTALQAALDAGGDILVNGTGTYYISSTLKFSTSNTRLILRSGVTIKATDTLGGPLVEQYQMRNSPTAAGAAGGAASGQVVTIDWVAGQEIAVAWPSHGFSSGDYIILDGAAQTHYRGVFPTYSGTAWAAGLTIGMVGVYLTNAGNVYRSTTTGTTGATPPTHTTGTASDGTVTWQYVGASADTLLVKIERKPAASATGTIYGYKALTDCYVIGGTFDFNYSNGTGNAGSGFDRIALIMWGIVRCGFIGCKVVDTQKFSYCFGMARDIRLSSCVAESNSDALKIYGPTYYGEVEKLSGWSGDDFFTFQPREADSFASTRFSWGDIIGVDVSDLTCERITPGLKVSGAYTSNVSILDRCSIKNVRVSASNYQTGVTPTTHPCWIGPSFDASNAGIVGKLEIENIEATARAVFLHGIVFDSITIDGIRAADKQPNTAQAVYAVYSETDCVGKLLQIKGIKANVTSWPTVNTHQLIRVQGTIEVCNIEGNEYYDSSNSTNLTFARIAKTVRLTRIANNLANRVGSFLQVSESAVGTEAPRFVLENNYANCAQGVSNTNANIDVTLINNYINASSNGVLRNNTAGDITVRGGGNVLSSVTYVRASGTGNLICRSTEIPFNVVSTTGVSYATGNMALHTGTNPGPCIANGTIFKALIPGATDPAA